MQKLHLALPLALAVAAAGCRSGSSVPPDPDGAAAAAGSAWIPLFDGATLDGWQVSGFGGDGDVEVIDGEIVLGLGPPMNGITWAGTPPSGDYRLALTARRLEGSDFFCGLTFPVGDEFLTLVVGGWGGSLVGLSCLDGQDASSNETTQFHRFVAGIPYRIQVTVAAGRVQAQLDGRPILDVAVSERLLSLRPEVLRSRPLGIASYATRAALRDIAWQPLPVTAEHR